VPLAGRHPPRLLITGCSRLDLQAVAEVLAEGADRQGCLNVLKARQDDGHCRAKGPVTTALEPVVQH